MATYFMFGDYSAEGIQEISADRTKKCNRIIEKLGGEIRSIYALIGSYDIVIIVDLPGREEAIKASIAIGVEIGMSFQTFPALSAERFDQIVAEA
jgi:uncharacterized protein with GYD domain